MNPSESTRTCAISGRSVPANDCIPCSALRPALLKFIQTTHPGLTTENCIDKTLLTDLKADYVEAALLDDIGEITDLERNVIESLRQNELLSANPDEIDTLAQRTFGQRLSDRIASFGGSWRFIIIFSVMLLLWVTVNSFGMSQHIDPYPFIFLNLILSCIAAIQAPVIMMSQNRQETRDRMHAEMDYQINLKAELGIRHLHEKLDHLLHHQSERLLEIQQIQVEMLRKLVDEKKA